MQTIDVMSKVSTSCNQKYPLPIKRTKHNLCAQFEKNDAASETKYDFPKKTIESHM